ncbi:hypothetical protein P3T36_002261 [Kitasatospora sp. MAP12-15]|uniref:hypothetical protein n=1 Tax=unclassified Kitasatospora TaxID=2633591 RepID=UPI0024761F11|nr:hypothetical protein [Kitasatospora sp. MAP12-44]MDH6108819.1 hypothetical protein [Kitasatospora sp. MAP12-44]
MRRNSWISRGGRVAVTAVAAALLSPLHPAAAAAAAPAAPTAAAVADSPVAQARATGRQVELTDRHTDSSRTFANPNGTFTYQSYVRPQWVKRGNSWVSLDATLKRGSDGYSPVASSSPLVLSAGGSGPLATMTVDGKQLALSWPTPLPAPVVAGDVATYPNVLPSGVDLQVSATQDGGIQEVLVVKNATAAADPALSALTLATKTSPGLAVSADASGNVAVKDATGRALFSAPTPMMWDSRSTGTAVKSAATNTVSDVHGPGAGARVAPIRTTVHGSDLALVPDHAMLADPGAKYPIFLDPAVHPVSTGTQAYAPVQQAFPSTTQYNAGGSSYGVGYQGFQAPTGIERVFYQLAVPSSIYGATVLNAQVDATEVFASACSITTQVNAYWSGAINSGTDWNNQPSLIQQESSSFFNLGCGSPETGAFDFTSLTASAASGHWANMTIGLVNASETNDINFVRFATNPSLSITYDNAPGTPGSLGVTPSNTSNGTMYVTSSRPTFSATATDPDGDPVQLNFQVLSGTTVVASGTSSVNSGTPATWTPSTALADGAYTWKVQATDGTLSSGWSAAQPVTFSTTPAIPTVTVSGYPANTWTAAQSGSTAVTFADSSVSVASYTYRLDGGTPVTVTGSGSGATVQLTFAAGWHTLAYSATSTGGSVSPTASYGFGVGAAALTGPVDGSSGDGTAVALTATSAPGLTSVRYQYRLGTSGAFTDLPVANVTSAGTPISAWPLATNSDGSSPALVWNAALSVQSNGLLQVQALFTDANGLTSTSAPAGYTMTRPNAPSVPTQVNVTPLSGAAKVTWAPPATGAAYVTSYTVTASNGGFTFGTPATVAANAPLTVTFGNMTNGGTYPITVVANSPYGSSPSVTVTAYPTAG